MAEVQPERSSGLARAGRLGLGVAIGATVTLAAMLVLEPAVRASDQPPSAMPAPSFVEETGLSGVRHVYDGDFRFFVGGGVAVLDCDDDGRPDLYLAGGSNRAALYRNESSVGGILRFAPLAAAATDLTQVTGAYPLDVDGDGLTDLAVLRLGENVLLRGVGDCRFERANEDWGFEGGDEWTVGFSATWEPAASAPTLAFGNYLDPADDQRASCSDGALVRPSAAADLGTAAELFAAPLPLSPSWCSLSLLFSDWDRSGRRDLRVTNDRHYYRDGQDQLWRVTPEDAPRLYTAEEGWQPLQIWGMGIASHDLTGDGRPEVFLTSQGDNKLQTLSDEGGGPRYEDIAIHRGVTAHRPHAGGDTAPSTAWHAEFQDVNNDGFVDLFVSKGNVEAMPGFASRDPNNLLIGQADGTFTERAEDAGIVGFDRTRGAALADLNLDGMLDLVAVNRRADARIWRNVGWGSAARPAPMGDRIAVRLEQGGPNRDAIGSWIEVDLGDRTIARELTVGGGHAGGQLGWVHIGLGDTERPRIRVQWPDGELGPWFEPEGHRFAVIERGAPELRPWTPPAD